MKRLVSLFLVLMLLVPAVIGQARAPIEFRLAHADPTDVTTARKHAQAVVFATLVNARSGGRINVTVHGAGALGGEREFIESVRAGIIQGGIASGIIANFFPSAMVTDIPFLFPSAEVAWRVLDGPFGQRLSRMFVEQTGMRNLAFAEVGFRNMTNNVRPIRTPADMRGLRMRVMETPLYVTMMRALGATPTPIAWPEVYTALQTGVVDGQENPIPSILMGRLHEVQRFVTMTGHVYGVDWFAVNERFFRGLPEDLQYILVDSAQIATAVSRGVSQLITAQGLETLRAARVEVYVPTEAELGLFRRATQGPVIEWLRTRVDPALINEALAAVEEVVRQQRAALR